jgi:hypothetical protein
MAFLFMGIFEEHGRKENICDSQIKTARPVQAVLKSSGSGEYPH